MQWRSARRTDHATSRWRTLGLASLVAGTQVSLALAGAKWVEPRWLHAREFDITLPQLPLALDGARIAFLSDMHVGGPGPNAAVADAAFQMVVDWRPELILLGGDYFDHGARPEIEPDWGALAACAPTLGVLGNHDFSAGVDQVYATIETLAQSGVTVLANAAATVSIRSGHVSIIGVGDPYGERDDLPKAMSDASSDASARILLAHAPMIVDQLDVGSVLMTLAGHTHGGQIRLSPFRHETPLDAIWWIDRLKGQPPARHQRGFFWERGSLLCVNQGLGTTSLGLRFFAPPEITLMTLRAETGDETQPCDTTERYVTETGVTRRFVRI
jgi:uncharacterized protein